ncbi:MAG: T9SS type A sorting domain-containing protein [Bacteroidia bacterium]|nr:T9SS type A sorting domain-containing protein [Bacteroidia bacterium]MDW8347099.1 T9SS type A sorting domain-containing protein [Bacteroidia bacterium]
MKQIISSFLVLVCLFISSLRAQSPTITNSALPSIGNSITTISDTDFVATMTPGSSSAQTWNYLPDANSSSVTTFVSPTGLYGSTHFPTANMATDNTLDSEVVYFVKNSSGLFIDGFYQYKTGQPVTNVPINFAPKNYLLVPTPLTYGNTGADTAKAVALFNYFGNDLKLSRTMYKSYHADAFGSLTIPAGTYSNTLRVKENLIILDSVYIKVGVIYYYFTHSSDTSQTYYWLQNAHPVTLLTLSMKKPFTLNQSETAEYNTITTHQNDYLLTQNKIKSYPNPVQDVLYVNLRETKDIQTIRVIDIAGRVLLNENISGYDLATISMTHYPPGVYIYQIFDNKGNLYSADKFIKQ